MFFSFLHPINASISDKQKDKRVEQLNDFISSYFLKNFGAVISNMEQGEVVWLTFLQKYFWNTGPILSKIYTTASNFSILSAYAPGSPVLRCDICIAILNKEWFADGAWKGARRHFEDIPSTGDKVVVWKATGVGMIISLESPYLQAIEGSLGLRP